MRKDNDLLKAAHPKPVRKPRPMAFRVPILRLWRKRRPVIVEKRVAR